MGPPFPESEGCETPLLEQWYDGVGRQAVMAQSDSPVDFVLLLGFWGTQQTGDLHFDRGNGPYTVDERKGVDGMWRGPFSATMNESARGVNLLHT